MRIIDIIDQCDDGRHQGRTVDQIAGLMIHRCGIDLQTGVKIGLTGPAICDAFLGRKPEFFEVSRATNRQNAYTFYIGGQLGDEPYNGWIWQALELEEIGWHGLRFSRGYIGIAVIGDPRYVALSHEQLEALERLCTDLAIIFGIPVARIVGHGEETHAHGGLKAPGKPGACPGDLLDMDLLRAKVSMDRAMKDPKQAITELHHAGAVIPREMLAGAGLTNIP